MKQFKVTNDRTDAREVKGEAGVGASRLRYITQQLGLKFDPFTASVAEHEVKDEQKLDLPIDLPRFFAYFSQPLLRLDDGSEASFKELRLPEHFFVYGKSGAGKTTFRYNLDADCRIVLDQTFAVHYVLGQELKRPLQEDEHGERLAQAIARDVFVQIVEQYLPSHEISEAQYRALRLLIDLGGPLLSRLVKSLITDPVPEGFFGLADHWRMIGRAAVRYTAASPELLRMLQKVQEMKAILPADKKGWEKVKIARKAADDWKVENLLILVDGVDAVDRQAEEMLKYILPLLKQLNFMGRRKIYCKFFLPLEMESLLDRWQADNKHNLISSVRKVRIMWDEDTLKNAIQQRFVAAGGRYKGFDELSKGELQGKLDHMILAEAKGSPRRMLRLVSNLINAHVASQPAQAKLDEKDWKLMQEMGRDFLDHST